MHYVTLLLRKCFHIHKEVNELEQGWENQSTVEFVKNTKAGLCRIWFKYKQWAYAYYPVFPYRLVPPAGTTKQTSNSEARETLVLYQIQDPRTSTPL